MRLDWSGKRAKTPGWRDCRPNSMENANYQRDAKKRGNGTEIDLKKSLVWSARVVSNLRQFDEV